MRRWSTLRVALLLVGALAPAQAADRAIEPISRLPVTSIPVSLPGAPIEPALLALPALEADVPSIPRAMETPAALPVPAPQKRETLIGSLSAPQPKVEGGSENVGGAAETDFLARAQLGGAPVGHEALVEAYQDGGLDRLGASAATKAVLEKAADRAVREKLGAANFKTYYLYGGLFGTKMYEAPELPGVLLKIYASPIGRLRERFGWMERAYHGYQLAKQRLGDYFAHTTIVKDVEVTINGRRRRVRWGLVQEKVAVEKITNFNRRSYETLLGMLKRGVRDNDQRPRNLEPIDQARNLGEAPDGRFVHFDADFFAAEEPAEEGPKRVRDPPVLQKAIREAQLTDLRDERHE